MQEKMHEGKFAPTAPSRFRRSLFFLVLDSPKGKTLARAIKVSTFMSGDHRVGDDEMVETDAHKLFRPCDQSAHSSGAHWSAAKRKHCECERDQKRRVRRNGRTAIGRNGLVASPFSQSPFDVIAAKKRRRQAASAVLCLNAKAKRNICNSR